MLHSDPFLSAFRELIQAFSCLGMNSLVRYARESGLSMSQIGALFYISRKGGSGVTDLGEDLGVSSAAASQMLERLVQQGLILRTEDPADRRVKQLALTEKGTRVIQESFLRRQDWLVELATKLSLDEKEKVMVALDILNEKTKQFDAVSTVDNASNNLTTSIN